MKNEQNEWTTNLIVLSQNDGHIVFFSNLYKVYKVYEVTNIFIKKKV